MRKITKYTNNKPFYDKKVALEYIQYIVKYIKERVELANAKGVIVGISGGIDSALTIHLAKLAFGKNVLGVVLPINNMEHDVQDIKLLEKSVGLKFSTISLWETNKIINMQLNLKNQMAKSNIMPRLRMTALYALAQENNYLVLGTDNYDEVYIGYFTKYGDGGADILPISKLTKGEVRFLASLVGVPLEIINKKPSAGLWENQNDEDELGFTYQELDFYLDHLDKENKIIDNISNDTISKIQKLHINSQHKRDGAYSPLGVSQINNSKEK